MSFVRTFAAAVIVDVLVAVHSYAAVVVIDFDNAPAVRAERQARRDLERAQREADSDSHRRAQGGTATREAEQRETERTARELTRRAQRDYRDDRYYREGRDGGWYFDDRHRDRNSGKGKGHNRVHGVPPGHMPPLGQCRIWFDGRPPGHQPPPGDCRRLAHRVPPGARLIEGR
jgi:hypothetical protein